MVDCYFGHISVIVADVIKPVLAEQLTPNVIRRVMRHQTEVAVDGTERLLAVMTVGRCYVLSYALQGTVGYVCSERLDVGSKELYALADLADGQLSHVQLQPELVSEETPYLRHKG